MTHPVSSLFSEHVPSSLTPLIESSFTACRKATKFHAKSFYFSSFALPSAKRDAAYAIYAFCRYVDDVVDEAEFPAAAKAAVTRLHSDLDRMLDHNDVDPDFLPAFRWTVDHYKIERQLFRDLIHGVGMDLERVRIADEAALREYCYYVAGVVGLMMCRIFGLAGDEGRSEAIEMGIAMQITNIARDVGEDLGRDRIYLPATMLDRFKVTESDLAAGNVTPHLRALMQELIATARTAYRDATRAIRLLDDDGSQLTVRIMAGVYGGILDEIEAIDYSVLARRASTTFPRKCALALRAWHAQRMSRRSTP